MVIHFAFFAFHLWNMLSVNFLNLRIFVGILNRSLWNFKPDVSRLCVCVCVCVCVRERERVALSFCWKWKWLWFPRTNIIKSRQHANCYVKKIAAVFGRQCLRSFYNPSHCIEADLDLKETFPTIFLSRIALSSGTDCVDSRTHILPLNVTARYKA